MNCLRFPSAARRLILAAVAPLLLAAAVHAVGGTLGALLTGIFATASVNGNLNTNLQAIVGHSLWLEQLKAMGLTVVLSVVSTVIIAYAIKATIGLRPDLEDEQTGLDLTDHGEEGYIYEAKS